ncbi:hypothetical protein TUM17568_19970 [Klebsiella oxytoca]|nr:hypothetical protein TUM17568_19970 [Klebsiella oxytoca]
MENDDSIKNHQKYKDQNAERKIIEKHNFLGFTLIIFKMCVGPDKKMADKLSIIHPFHFRH